MADRSPLLGSVLVVGAAVLWGTTGTAQALGPAAASPLAVGTVRLVIGAAGLVAVAAVTGRLRPAGPPPWRAVVVTAIGVAAYQPLFFGGVARTGVALGTVVAIGSGPVFVGLIASAVFRWRPTLRWTVAVALAVAGVALISGPTGGGDPLGIAMAAGSGLSYAVFSTGSKRLLEVLPPLGAMAWAFGGGGVLLAPVLALVDLGWLGTGAGAASAAWLGLAATTAAYVLFGYGLRLVEVPVAAVLALAEPLTATALGVAVLAERPRLAGWLGAALVLVALALVSRIAQPRVGSVTEPA